MRQIVILFLLTFTLSATAQNQAPRKANLITITADTADAATLFRHGVEVLKAAGHTFETMDKDFYQCSTKSRRPGKVMMEYRIELSVSDSVMSVRSYVRLLGGFPFAPVIKEKEPWERGANKNLSTSRYRFGWNQQVDFTANLLDRVSGKVEYLIE